jgi:hypothetical protein
MTYNMLIKAKTPEDYIGQIPDERQPGFRKLRQVILENLPAGFEETILYDMIAYVVPHTLYPKGYHVNPGLPLSFINLASQKNFIAFYHMGLYASKDLLDWFLCEYPKHSNTKPDMGKSCVRFRKTGNIPYDLLGELAGKITPEVYIKLYESGLQRSRKNLTL